MKDTIIPPDLYTCRAEPEVPFDQNPDYIKCFSCESESKTSNKCKNPPKNDSSMVTWCNSKNQKCFSKALYKESGKKSELISFSRGCASLSDLDVKTDESSDAKVNCIKKPNSTQACYETCEKSFCNTISEFKSSSANSNIAGTTKLFIVFVLTVCSHMINSNL
jgi:hypothetical protein